MFLDEFPDLLESSVSCDRLFVLGDINFHFDSDFDVSVADLKKNCRTILAYSNLSMSPCTHRRGHTLDWLITNRVVDVEELCVVDKLISDHFVISFTLHFRKPMKTTKEVRSRNVRALNTDNFKTDSVASAMTKKIALNICFGNVLISDVFGLRWKQY